MKTKLLVLCCLPFFMIEGIAYSQRLSWSIGLEGGQGVSFIYGNQSVYANPMPSLAGAAGIYGEVGFAPRFSAKLALHYERKSGRTENLASQLPPGGTLQFNLDYVSVPLLVKWYFGRRINFFVNAGPTVSYLIQQSLWHIPASGSATKVADETPYYRPFDVAITAGAGVTIPFAKRFLASVELRDNFGLLNIRSGVSDFEHNNYSPEPVANGYTNSTLLLIGVAWRFGNRNHGLPCTPDDPGFQYIKTD